MRQRWWRRCAVSAVLLTVFLAADYYAYPHLAPPGGRSFNRGENGLWLRYRWYFGRWSDSDERRLATRLRNGQIRYAYFHTREIGSNGRLRFRKPAAARRLVKAVHRHAPSVKVIAWISASNQRRLGPIVDLATPEMRRAMVGEALWLVNECGFDGVQWDYEVCKNGDSNFLRLMAESRAALPRSKLLSAAVPMWLPSRLRRWGWATDYFALVAATCDQIAVMCYDSGAYFPRFYVWLVRQQARHVTRAVARGNERCRVLLGAPTYRRGGTSHNPRAENIRLALKGVREGLSTPSANRRVLAGVSLFADYTTQPEDWWTYRALWLRRSAPSQATIPR